MIIFVTFLEIFFFYFLSLFLLHLILSYLSLTIYHLCHFTIGLNPEAGISGNLVEDERKVAAVDFGFGYQSSDLGGTVGPCDYHMDVVISSPSIFLDGKEMSGRGKFNPKMGFKNMVKPRSH